MNSLTLVEPEGYLSAQEIAWHNVKVCDEIHHLIGFSAASMGWMKAHPTATFQDFECELRKKGLYTHLFCRKPPKPTTEKNLKNPNDLDKPCKWMVYFSCRPPPHALNEVLENAPS